MQQPTITGALRRARRVFWAPDTAARPATATAVPAAPRKAKLELRREGKTMQNYMAGWGFMMIYIMIVSTDLCWSNDDLMMIMGLLSLSLSSSPLLDEFIYGATATDSFLGGMFLNAFKELLARFFWIF